MSSSAGAPVSLSSSSLLPTPWPSSLLLPTPWPSSLLPTPSTMSGSGMNGPLPGPTSTLLNASLSLTSTTSTLLTAHTPTPSPPTTPPQGIFLFPDAGVVAIVIVVFLLAILVLLVIRKCIMDRGKQVPECPRVCVMSECCDRGGWECCRGLCESLDCEPPDCNAWLDNICPTKQRCSMFCTGLVSCSSCVSCMESCQQAQMCPDCSAVTCPDCDCCNFCHCTVKMPECQQISCLCFECGRPT